MKKLGLIFLLTICSVCFSSPLYVFALGEKNIRPVIGKKAYYLDDNNSVSVGNLSDANDFQAHAKMSFWKGENWLSVEEEGLKGEPTLTNNILTLDLPDRKVEWFQNVGISDPNTWQSSLRWVNTFKSKPLSNKITHKLAGWQEYDFWKQPTIAADQVEFPSATLEYTTENGVEMCRFDHPNHPEGPWHKRVVAMAGGYVVKHKTKRNHILGGTNYTTGTNLNIPRSKAVDADGKWVWCDIDITDGVLTETIDQKFLDTAKYPVRVNATFGKTDVGPDSFGHATDYIYAVSVTGAVGNATMVSWYATNLSATPCTWGFYDDTGATYPKDIIGQSAGANESGGGDNWVHQNLTGTPATTIQTYWIARNNDDDSVVYNYDAEAEQTKYVASAYAGGALTTPYPGGASIAAGRTYSAYVTYTVPSAGAAQVIFVNIN